MEVLYQLSYLGGMLNLSAAQGEVAVKGCEDRVQLPASQPLRS